MLIQSYLKSYFILWLIYIFSILLDWYAIVEKMVVYHADWKSWPWKVRPNYVHLCLTKKWLRMSVSIVFVVYSFLFLPLILNIWAMANPLPTGLTHLRLFFGVRCHQFLNWRREGEMTFMRYVFIYIFLMLLMLSCICLLFFVHLLLQQSLISLILPPFSHDNNLL